MSGLNAGKVEEMIAMVNLHKSAGVQGYIKPVEMAVLYTPIILLAGIQIGKQNFSRWASLTVRFQT